MNKIIILLLLITFYANAKSIIYIGFQENEFIEYQTEYEKKIKSTWSGNKDVEFSDRVLTLRLKNKFTKDGIFTLNDSLKKYLENRKVVDAIIVTTEFISMDFTPHRSGIAFIGSEIRAELKLKFNFFDLSKGKKIYSTILVSKDVIPKGLIFWSNLEKNVTIDAREREAVVERLIDNNTTKSYNALDELLKGNIQNGNAVADDGEYEIIE